MPACFEASGSVRASRMQYLAYIAIDDQIFWPLTTYVSPLRSARVRSEARSDPAPGSEKPWHQMSPAGMPGRYRLFCSGVPQLSRVPGRWLSEIMNAGITGAPVRANSSASMIWCARLRSAPPYCLGQCGVPSPTVWRRAIQSRWMRTPSSSSASIICWIASGGTVSASHSHTAARKAPGSSCRDRMRMSVACENVVVSVVIMPVPAARGRSAPHRPDRQRPGPSICGSGRPAVR